jgi:hypothetical protein
MRRRFRETSVLGEYGAPAIHAALSQGGHIPVPSGGEHRSHPGPLRRARPCPPRASPTPAPRVSAGDSRRRLHRGPQDRRWPAADTPHCDLSAWRAGGCLGARAPHCEIHGRLPARALVARGPAPACPPTPSSTTTLSSRVRISSPMPRAHQPPVPGAGRHRVRNARRREQAAEWQPFPRRFASTPVSLCAVRSSSCAAPMPRSCSTPRPNVRGLGSMAASLGSRGRSHSPAYPILCLAPPRTRRATAANQHTLSPHTTAFPQRLMSDRQVLIIAQWPFWYVLKDRTFNPGLQWRQWRMLGRTV